MKITGNRSVARPPAEVLERLRFALAGGNFEVTGTGEDSLFFRHGTYLTQSAPLFPKRGQIRIEPADGGAATSVSFEVEVAPLAKAWLILFAVVFCWLIFPPFVVHRALVHHPKRLMENLLGAV